MARTGNYTKYPLNYCKFCNQPCGRRSKSHRACRLSAETRLGEAVQACSRCEEPLGEAFLVEARTGQRYHAWHEDY